jgi:hypothetical protein
MKILILLSVLVSGIILSGCIGEHQVQEVKLPEPDATQASVWTLTATSTDTPVPSPVATTVKPLTKYDKFVEWLKADATDKHLYILDPSKVYEDQYVCAQFTRDFLKNATDAGFEAYAVRLTGAVKGQDAWHMINAIVLDGKLYFVEPQNDIILMKEDLLKTYGFEYAYFAKEVYISRNNAELSNSVNYHTVIGLNGDNFLYLK